MKKLILAACFMVGFATIGTSQFHFAAGAQFVLDSPSAFGVQGKALYDITEDWRGSGSFTFYLDDIYSTAIDLDVHYTGLEVGDGFTLAPVAGFNITSIDVGFGIGGSSSSLNLGAFFEFALSDGMNLYAEPKFTFSNGGNFIVSGGILF